MQIKDHVFLVTGAGSGLGAAVTRALVSHGGVVVGCDLNREAGESLAEELRGRMHFIQTDVVVESAAQAAVQYALELHGVLHGLVNCAGVAPAEKLLGSQGVHGLSSFSRTIGINLIGTFNMLRLAAEQIAKAEPGEDGERGVIINTASVAAFDGQIGQAAYSASKAAVVGMTLPLARELARHGIRVMTIAPGLFETPMITAMPAEVQQRLGQSIPFPARLGHTEEFAELVLHICQNRMLNGEVIRLDGALRMSAK